MALQVLEKDVVLSVILFIIFENHNPESQRSPWEAIDMGRDSDYEITARIMAYEFDLLRRWGSLDRALVNVVDRELTVIVRI